MYKYPTVGFTPRTYATTDKYPYGKYPQDISLTHQKKCVMGDVNTNESYLIWLRRTPSLHTVAFQLRCWMLHTTW